MLNVLYLLLISLIFLKLLCSLQQFAKFFVALFTVLIKLYEL